MKRIFILYCLSLATIASDAQEKKLPSAQFVKQYYSSARLEFLDLYLDKTIYETGESIWFSTYIQNAPGISATVSVIQYLELIDPNSAVILRYKLLSTEGTAHGKIDLPITLKAGVYTVKVYTYWMQQFGEGYSATQHIRVINPRDPQQNVAETKSQSPTSPIDVTNSPGEWTITMPPTSANGYLLAHVNGNIILNHPIAATGFKVTLSKDQFHEGDVQLGWFGEDGHLIEELTLPGKSSSTLMIDVNKKKFKPREKVELSLSITDNSGAPVRGNFSIAVRRSSDMQPAQNYIPHVLLWRTITGQTINSSVFKETLVYPSSNISLKPIDGQASQEGENPDQQLASVEKIPPAINARHAHQLKTLIETYYGQSPTVDTYKSILLPSDMSFLPENYQELPDMGELIKEVVPQIKIQHRRNEVSIRVRNTEFREKVYFFKKNPLILVDGYKLEHPEKILSLKPVDVKRMDVVWSLNKLQRYGLTGLADNGIISIYTQKEFQYPADWEKSDLFHGFYSPIEFDSFLEPKLLDPGDQVPLLRNPVYWNPGVSIFRKGKVSFLTSDDLGDFVVEIKGYTHDGNPVFAQTSFLVEL